jgi:predicted DNA-binding transcriptional regulator AlpA
MRADLRIVGTVATADLVHPTTLAESQALPRLLWGWPEVTQATGIPKRTLQKELSAKRFPEPARRVGKRPYWLPRDVTRWAENESGKRREG